MNNIYDYLDYREFLKKRVEYMKETNPNFSYRYFNMKSGLKSSGHLKLVMDGHRNLGKKGMYNIARGLGLSDKESRFFEHLVCFSQAKTAEEKDHFYGKLVDHYPPKHAKIVEATHYKVFAHWYYIAILELVRLDDFRESARWISKKLRPNVPLEKVETAISELEEAGLLIRDDNGKLIRSEQMIATPEKVRSVAVIRFHEQLTHLGVNALKRDPVIEKEFSTLTIAMSKDNVERLKEKIQEFKKELHGMLETSVAEKTDVVHINLQLFKLTHGGI